jgi:hypothetical protein
MANAVLWRVGSEYKQSVRETIIPSSCPRFVTLWPTDEYDFSLKNLTTLHHDDT